ncbi:MAG: hypothetical protein GDA67_04560 [Nitrospira sp. CR1.3]|nr:hypothetical protein [Nitrospira sp. CR1.3]
MMAVRYLVFSMVLIVAATSAWSAGFDGPGTAPCGLTPTPTGQFTFTTAQYSATGQCTTYGSLGAPRTFPYTVRGSFSKNVAEEIIEIVPASISEPSHPSGKWTTRYTCASDPWLTPDGPPYEASLLRLKCPIISRTGPTPAQEGPRTSSDGKRLPTIGELFALWSSAKPMTAWTLAPAERQALTAKRDADLAEAKRKADQRLKAGIQQQSLVRPIVLAPTVGQRFFNQTSVPIKLSPPQGWVERQVELDGTPVKTGRMYMVRIERKNAIGNWVPHATLPVGAPQAESATGYTGFGAGAPPSGVTSPGSWRLSAQMSSPTQTGWSDWVEFMVMAPKTAIQKTPKMFGQ